MSLKNQPTHLCHELIPMADNKTCDRPLFEGVDDNGESYWSCASHGLQLIAGNSEPRKSK